MYEKYDDSVWDYVSEFNENLKAKAHADYNVDDLIKEGQEALMLYIHEKKLEDIVNKYLDKKKK